MGGNLHFPSLVPPSENMAPSNNITLPQTTESSPPLASNGTKSLPFQAPGTFHESPGRPRHIKSHAAASAGPTDRSRRFSTRTDCSRNSARKAPVLGQGSKSVSWGAGGVATKLSEAQGRGGGGLGGVLCFFWHLVLGCVATKLDGVK